MDKAVILARGLGTRMQKRDDSAELSEAQMAVAETGVKGMIPVGRSFLDYVISGLADAGYRRICLVIGPEHDVMRDYYGSVECQRVSIEFSVQAEPLGTADAVAAAERFAAGEEFCVINSDNYYPVESLRALRELGGAGMIGFEREVLISESNIGPERVRKFAVARVDGEGYLVRVAEKPSADVLAGMGGAVCISMNCWRFGPKIFMACRSISPSVRGELELPDAVQYAIDSLGERFCVVPVRSGVLDLSSRRDVAAVAARLADVEVCL
jgi:glucose-1-phosphate thymidylyltransferase